MNFVYNLSMHHFWFMNFVYNMSTHHNVTIISCKNITYWGVLFSYIIQGNHYVIYNKFSKFIFLENPLSWWSSSWSGYRKCSALYVICVKIRTYFKEFIYRVLFTFSPFFQKAFPQSTWYIQQVVDLFYL